MTLPGYQAEFQGIRRHGQEATREAERIRGVLHNVREAFATAGRPMGDDQYGAEMEKKYPVMRDNVMKAFEAYIDELDGTGEGLQINARTYESAELTGA